MSLSTLDQYWNTLINLLTVTTICQRNVTALLPTKHQPHKMVKHTQTFRSANCLSVFDHCVGLAITGLKYIIWGEECVNKKLGS